MRETCTYGSMRGRAFPRGVPLYSTPFCIIHYDPTLPGRGIAMRHSSCDPFSIVLTTLAGTRAILRIGLNMSLILVLHSPPVQIASSSFRSGSPFSAMRRIILNLGLSG